MQSLILLASWMLLDACWIIYRGVASGAFYNTVLFNSEIHWVMVFPLIKHSSTACNSGTRLYLLKCCFGLNRARERQEHQIFFQPQILAMSHYRKRNIYLKNNGKHHKITIIQPQISSDFNVILGSVWYASGGRWFFFKFWTEEV